MIASAFVATIMGIFLGYLVMIPFGTRLETKSQEEVLLKNMIIEGVMDIQAGHSAKIIEQKLYAQIPPAMRKEADEE